jgi:hypothetical protein
LDEEQISTFGKFADASKAALPVFSFWAYDTGVKTCETHRDLDGFRARKSFGAKISGSAMLRFGAMSGAV